MPTGRLTFLYPRLARALRQTEPLTRTRPVLASPCVTIRCHTTNSRRHGKAVQPQSHSAKDPEGAQPGENNPSEPAAEQEEEEPSDTAKTSSASSPMQAPEETKRAEDEVQETKSDAKKSGPMETVLYMNGPPDSIAAVKAHPPMPSSHFFDSYGMVNRLVEAGYERNQAITMMQAVRGLLRDKMAAAQDDLVSKSDVDNETYLFKAACSELSTEVKNNRRAADEVMREQRMRLQHEVDVIWQTLNHELLTLKDTVRGIFDDRKMAVREEQKANAGSIQKINYKISTLLTSDVKSDIEGLRWILIRRSALGIAFMAVVSLATLRYAAYVKQQRTEELERRRREEEERRKMFAGAGEVRGPVTDPDEILATA